MIVIRKKRLILILTCIVLSVSFYMVNMNSRIETVETVSFPVSQKVIVLDAGHGVPDEGDCLLTLNNNN